jgi:hypothetical protein
LSPEEKQFHLCDKVQAVWMDFRRDRKGRGGHDFISSTG